MLTLTLTDHHEALKKFWTKLGFKPGKLERDRARSLTRNSSATQLLHYERLMSIIMPASSMT